MRLKGIVLLSTLLLFSQLAVFASDKVKEDKHKTSNYISGKVTDIYNGEPLAGVLITVEGNNEKFYTDFDGYFSVPVSSNNITLKTSIISYKSKKAVITENSRNRELVLALESI